MDKHSERCAVWCSPNSCDVNELVMGVCILSQSMTKVIFSFSLSLCFRLTRSHMQISNSRRLSGEPTDIIMHS